MAKPKAEMPAKYDPHATEVEWCNLWNDKGIYAWDPARGRDETFVVDTPPPTVSGSLHVGHLFSYSHQDFIVRYQRMRGKNIYFPIGWDDNGLPTERRVQNMYNVKCEPHVHYDASLTFERGRKGDAQPISRRNFIELCEIVTKEDEEAFRRLWTRLGLSYDWNQEYATIDTHCRRISQLSFIELLEKDEVYQADRPVMWDVDFQTAIAQAEVVDKEVPSAYNFLRFGIRGDESAHLVIATTRPELLPACVAVLVHPDDERYAAYVGKEAVTPLFHVPVPIMADEKADPEKGTGVVMVCTFGDQTDIEWWQKYDLPLRQVIDRRGCLRRDLVFQPLGAPKGFTFKVGNNEYEIRQLDDNSLCPHLHSSSTIGFDRFTPVFGISSEQHFQANLDYQKISGKYVNGARRELLVLLEDAGAIVKEPEAISHAVRFYEKGDRPLEYVPTRQWYTHIMNKKEALLGQGRKIQWHPEFMGGRYASWVEGLNQDWCLSRQRYFGVPIPVWYKLGSLGQPLYDERIVPAAETLPIDPLDDCPPGYTDDQRDKPNGFTGDPDVFDTWATSSLTPQIATHWKDDMGRHQKLFPMDIRPQSHEIIRTWAFYTIVKAYLHENEIPWRNVIISGWILDPDRKKMSKSQGNVVTPEPLIDQFGADAVRYWAARARLGVDTAYDEQVFKIGKKLCTKLFNASKFAIGQFAGVDADLLVAKNITEEMDRAVIAELRPVIERATAAFDVFDYAQALSLVEEFFWQTFCDNYLEIAKPRTYDEEVTPGRISAAATLRLIHRALIRMFAPYLPYLAEEIWSWAYNGDAGMNESVHRSPWPSVDEFAEVAEPSKPGLYAESLRVIDIVRKAKSDNNVSIKAPVTRLEVHAKTAALAELLDLTRTDVKRMLNIEEYLIAVGHTGEGDMGVVVGLEQPEA